MDLEIVKQVIVDMELEERGATLYYALDPYDIVAYCFPVNPGESVTRNLDVVADEQAALYEVATRNPPPVILGEYLDEIDDILHYVTVRMSDDFEKAATFRRLLRDVETNRPELVAQILEDKKKKDPENFNIVLAISLGLYSLGQERLRELFGRLAPPPPEVNRALQEIEAEYRGPESAEWLERQILKVVPTYKRRSIAADARAIDRLFFINSRLEHAYEKGELPNRHIFLYLSSANRSTELFRLAEVQARFPVINRKRFSIHRLAEHIFTRLTYRDPALNHRAELGQSLKELGELESLLRRDWVRRMNRKLSSQLQPCARCVLEGGTEEEYSNCPDVQLCQTLREAGERDRQRRTRKRQNLGLMLVASDYKELRDVDAGSLETQKILDFFLSVADDQKLRDENEKWKRQVDELFGLQVAFRNFVPFTLGHSDMPVVYDRSAVRFFRSLVNFHPEYRAVFDRLRDSETAASSREKFIYYDEALKEFMELEGGDPVELHELVRVIVYLDCPSDAGDDLAYQHALVMLDSFERYKPEFRLVLALVSPRVRLYDKGEWYASEALDDPKYPAHQNDPRLHFARARNSIEWLTTITEDQVRQAKWDMAIAELNKCLDLCAPNYESLRPLAHNNLAYVYCLRSPSGEVDESDLKVARENLDTLKTKLPKESWPEGNVNFFHTEALIERCEAASLRRAGELDKAWVKLNNAAREIAVAVERRPNRLYKQLRDLIAKERDAVSKQTAAKTGQSLVPLPLEGGITG